MSTMTAERNFSHVGESCGCANHDHDLIHELSNRLDAMWRYDQYIANAEGHAALQNLWRDLKSQEQKNIHKLKSCVNDEIKQNCF